MADITKTNEQIAAWDKNLERLKNGEFGAYKTLEEHPEVMLRYWKAQAEAGYPSASDNVRYFEEMIRKENKLASELNREQIIKALECCTNSSSCENCPFEPKGDCYKGSVHCSEEMMRDALALINSQEQRIKELAEEVESLGAEKEHLDLVVEGKLKRTTALEKQVLKLTEENERLKRVGVPDNDVYIRLTDAKHAIMDYIGEQTASKYASSAECKSARYGAEGAMNELDYLIPANVAPIADTVNKMYSMIKERCIKGGIYPAFVASVVTDVAKELLEEK